MRESLAVGMAQRSAQCRRLLWVKTRRLRHRSSKTVSAVHQQAVAGAPGGLQMQRIGWVALDLAAQPVDLNIDCPLVGGDA